MKKIIALVGIAILLALVAFFVMKYNSDLSTQVVQQDNLQTKKPAQNKESAGASAIKQQTDSAIEAVVENTKQKDEIIGVISSVATPNNREIKYLEINADMVDLDGIKDVDFTKKSVSLPMVRETFKVVVDGKTKLVKFDGKDSIEPGMMVRAVSGASIYEVKEFVATEVEFIAKR